MAARITTTDRVFASLRESILSGEFPAGSLHSIYRLADLLEVSRTPVREAVLRLADVGLVTIERNRGVRIRGVSVADIRAGVRAAADDRGPGGRVRRSARKRCRGASARWRRSSRRCATRRSAADESAVHRPRPRPSITRSAAILGNAEGAARGRRPAGLDPDAWRLDAAPLAWRWRRSSTSTCRSSRRSRRGTPRPPQRVWRSTSINTGALLMAQAATPDDPAPERPDGPTAFGITSTYPVERTSPPE